MGPFPDGQSGDSSSDEEEIARLRRELRETHEELARTRAALRDAEEHAEHLFRKAPCVMVLTSADDFTILDVNDEFVRKSGYAREDVVGRPTHEFPWWPSEEARTELLAALTRDGSISNLETRFVSQGREIVTLLNACKVTLRGKTCVLTHTADITERTRAEQERLRLTDALRRRERLESLGMVAGGIAHDFNNLLVGILGNAELMLASTGGSSPWVTPLRAIIQSAERAAEHTRELLDYAGRGLSKPTVVDLAELIADVEDLVQPHADEFGQRVEITKREEPLWAQADAGQLTRMLVALIKNALEAGFRGATVRVVLAAKEGLLEIRVSDEGRGMDADTRARIFDPFFSTKHAGHGLGLASVQSIVQRHHGAIEVESSPGRGSTFVVRLPATHPPEDYPHREGPKTEPSRRGRILLVDDEVSVRDTGHALLTQLGFEVDEASDGTSAIRHVKSTSEPYCAVLLDATMPGLDTRATLREIRAVAPELPVLLCSGYSRADFSEELDRDPMLDFLAKPYRRSELLRMLAKLMG